MVSSVALAMVVVMSKESARGQGFGMKRVTGLNRVKFGNVRYFTAFHGGQRRAKSRLNSIGSRESKA